MAGKKKITPKNSEEIQVTINTNLDSEIAELDNLIKKIENMGDKISESAFKKANVAEDILKLTNDLQVGVSKVLEGAIAKGSKTLLQELNKVKINFLEGQTMTEKGVGTIHRGGKTEKYSYETNRPDPRAQAEIKKMEQNIAKKKEEAAQMEKETAKIRLEKEKQELKKKGVEIRAGVKTKNFPKDGEIPQISFDINIDKWKKDFQQLTKEQQKAEINSIQEKMKSLREIYNKTMEDFSKKDKEMLKVYRGIRREEAEEKETNNVPEKWKNKKKKENSVLQKAQKRKTPYEFDVEKIKKMETIDNNFIQQEMKTQAQIQFYQEEQEKITKQQLEAEKKILASKQIRVQKENAQADIQKYIKELKVKPINVKFDAKDHSYTEILPDGREGRKATSITTFAGKVSGNSDLAEFMQRGRDALKEGRKLEDVYSPEEMKRYNNTINAANRGTVIHKAIELLETGVAEDVNDLVKIFHKLNKEAKDESEKFIGFETSRGKFAYKAELDDYKRAKQKYGLGNVALSEQSFAMEIDGELLAGTFDELLTNGTLLDFKTGAVHPDLVGIQTNLYRILLGANASKLGNNLEGIVTKMGVLQVPSGGARFSKKAEANYGEIEIASIEMIKSWIEAFKKGVQIDVPNLVKYGLDTRTFDIFDENRQYMVSGDGMSFKGRWIGSWANEYADLKEMSEREALPQKDMEAYRAIIENLDGKKKKTVEEMKTLGGAKVAVKKFVGEEELSEIKHQMKEIIKELADAFLQTEDDELAERFRRKMNQDEEYFIGTEISYITGAKNSDNLNAAKKRGQNKFGLFEAVAEELAGRGEQIDTPLRDYTEIEKQTQTEEEKEAQQRKQEDTNLEEATAETIQALQTIDDFFEGVKNFLKDWTLKPDSEKKISDAIEFLKIVGADFKTLTNSDAILEELGLESDYFSKDDLGFGIGKNTKRLDEKAENDQKTNADLAEEEIANEVEDDETQRHFLLTFLEKKREDLKHVVAQMRKEASDVVKAELLALEKSLDSTFTFLSREDKGQDVIEKQAFHRVARLLTSSDTIEFAAEELASKTQLNTQEALKLILQNEKVKAEYLISKRAREAMLDEDGNLKENIDEAMRGLKGITDQEIAEIFEQYKAYGDNKEEFNKALRKQMEIGKSGLSRKQIFQRTQDGLVEEIALGRTINPKENNFDRIENLNTLIQDIQNQKRTAIFDYKGKEKEDFLSMLNSFEKYLLSIKEEEEKKQNFVPTLPSDYFRKEDFSNKKILYYDLETSGLLGDRNAKPVSFGMTPSDDLEKTKEWFLDYGSDEANYNNVLKMLRQDHDAAIQMRKYFDVNAEDVKNPTEDLKNKIIEIYNKNKISKEQLFKEMMNYLSQGYEIGGFNTNSFDNEMLGRFFGKKSEEYKTLFPNGNKSVDMREYALNEYMGGTFEGWTMEKIKENSPAFSKGFKLQQLLELFTGSMDIEGAHLAGADSKSTAIVANYINNGILALIGEAVRQVGQSRNISGKELYSSVAPNMVDLFKEKGFKKDTKMEEIIGAYDLQYYPKEMVVAPKKEDINKPFLTQELKTTSQGITEFTNSVIIDEVALEKGTNAIKQEAEAFKEVNKALTKHNKLLTKSIELETDKANVALVLTEQLGVEGKALDREEKKVAKSGGRNSGKIKEVAPRISRLSQNLIAETIKSEKKSLELNEQINALDANSTEEIGKRIALLKDEEKKRENILKEVQKAGLEEEFTIGLAAKRGVTLTNAHAQNIKIGAQQKAQTAQDKRAFDAIKGYYKDLYTAQQERKKIDKTLNPNMMSKAEKRAYEEAVITTEKELAEINARRVEFNRDTGEVSIYKDGGLFETIRVSEEQRAKINQHISQEQIKQEGILKRINTETFKSKGFFAQIALGFKNSLRNLTDYTLAYEVIGKIKQTFQQTIQVTRELDKVLVDLQIATNGTREETQEMLFEYAKMGKEIGRTTQEIAAASNDWLRAGYAGAEAAELTKASMYLSTLGMIDSAQATEYLISTMKGWKLQAEEVMSVVDALTSVDIAAAISAGDLALGMSRANVSAQLAGSSMDKFMGYITTIADVSQKSAESVGESMKTIYSRWSNVKVGKFNPAEGEEDTDGVYEGLNDIEIVLNKLGIKYRETANEFRNFDEVMDEIGQKWSTFSQKEQSALATAIAGTRQRENVLILMENWDAVSKYANIAANSQGMAAQKMLAYNDSIEASQKRVTAAFEEFVMGKNMQTVLKLLASSFATLVENLDALIVSATIFVGLWKMPTLLEGIGKLAIHFEKMSLSLQSMSKGDFSKIKETFNQVPKNLGKYRVEEMGMSRSTGSTQSAAQDLKIAGSKARTEMEAGGKKVRADLEAAGKQAIKDAKTESQIEINSAKTESAIENQGAINEAMIENSSTTTRTIANGTGSAINAILTGSAMGTGMEGMDSASTLGNEAMATALGTMGANNNKKHISTVSSGKFGRYRLKSASSNIKLPTSAKLNFRNTAGSGLLTMGGAALGAHGGSNIGYAIGGDSGAMYGSIIGGVATPILGATIASAAGTALTSSFAAGTMGAKVGGVLGGPFGAAIGALGVGLVGAAIGAFTGGMKKKAEEEKKRLAEEAVAIGESLNEILETEAIVTSSNFQTRFRELSKGVDEYGRNVSLSDEDYAEYREAIDTLLELNPQLAKLYDSEGKALVERNTILEESIRLLKEEALEKKKALYSDEQLEQKGKDLKEETRRIRGEQETNLSKREKLLTFEHAFWGDESSLDTSYTGTANNPTELGKYFNLKENKQSSSQGTAIYTTNEGLNKTKVFADFENFKKLYQEFLDGYEAKDPLDTSKEQYEARFKQLKEEYEAYEKTKRDEVKLDQELAEKRRDLNETMSGYVSVLLEEGESEEVKDFFTEMSNSFEVPDTKYFTDEKLDSYYVGLKDKMEDVYSQLKNDPSLRKAIEEFYSLDLENITEEEYLKHQNKIGNLIKTLFPDEAEDIFVNLKLVATDANGKPIKTTNEAGEEIYKAYSISEEIQKKINNDSAIFGAKYATDKVDLKKLTIAQQKYLDRNFLKISVKPWVDTESLQKAIEEAQKSASSWGEKINTTKINTVTGYVDSFKDVIANYTDNGKLGTEDIDALKSIQVSLGISGKQMDDALLGPSNQWELTNANIQKFITLMGVAAIEQGSFSEESLKVLDALMKEEGVIGSLAVGYIDLIARKIENGEISKDASGHLTVTEAASEETSALLQTVLATDSLSGSISILEAYAKTFSLVTATKELEKFEDKALGSATALLALAGAVKGLSDEDRETFDTIVTNINLSKTAEEWDEWTEKGQEFALEKNLPGITSDTSKKDVANALNDSKKIVMGQETLTLNMEKEIDGLLSKLKSKSASTSKDTTRDFLNYLKALRSLIDKEYEAMMALDEGRYTAYFDKMRSALEAEATELQNIYNTISNKSITKDYTELDKKKDLADIEAEMIENEKARRNLDDEEVEDKISLQKELYQQIDATNRETYAQREKTLLNIVELNKELQKTADTEEEVAQRANQLTEAYKEWADLFKEEEMQKLSDAIFSGIETTANGILSRADRVVQRLKEVMGDSYSQELGERVREEYLDVGIEALDTHIDLAEEEDYLGRFNTLAQKRILLNQKLVSLKDNQKDVSKETLEIQKQLQEVEEGQRAEIANIQSEIHRYYDREIEDIEIKRDALNWQVRQEEAMLSLTEKRFDTANSLTEAQKQINKELRSSRLLTQYLDKETRKLVFNEADYTKLTKVIKGLKEDTEDMAESYYEDLLGLTEENIYLEQYITNEYERRLEIKMKELDIAKAELDLTKKEQELNNVLAEKNVRMLINGEWRQVANTENVRNALEAVEDAEAELERLKTEKEQEEIKNEAEAHIDSIKKRQDAYDEEIRQINVFTRELDRAFTDLLEPIQGIDTLMTQLNQMTIPDFVTAVTNFKETGVGGLATALEEAKAALKRFAETETEQKGVSDELIDDNINLGQLTSKADEFLYQIQNEQRYLQRLKDENRINTYNPDGSLNYDAQNGTYKWANDQLWMLNTALDALEKGDEESLNYFLSAMDGSIADILRKYKESQDEIRRARTAIKDGTKDIVGATGDVEESVEDVEDGLNKKITETSKAEIAKLEEIRGDIKALGTTTPEESYSYTPSYSYNSYSYAYSAGGSDVWEDEEGNQYVPGLGDTPVGTNKGKTNKELKEEALGYAKDDDQKALIESLLSGYASGTTSARGGISLVGEEGPELRVLSEGSGIIPNRITEELWAFGSNPTEYLSNIWRNIQAFNPLSGYGIPAFSSNITTNNQTVNIENIELNNVTNGNNFLSELNSFLKRTTKVTENK